MFETQLVFKNKYRWDLKPVKSVLIPYLFDDTSLIISVEAQPLKNYKSSGRIDKILIDYPNKLVASSQILRFNNQEIQFPERGRYKLEFFPNAYLGKTKISIYKMFFSSQTKQQTTNAQPTAEISVGNNQKSTILTEKSDGSRHSFLIVNAGTSTAYFKYAPIGTDLTATNNGLVVSSTVYDFSLAGGEKFIDPNASQNAIVGICSGALATTKLKITEYIYS
ncbi:MAG: hypothetical protein V7K18_25090 [Nostoc sp.]|uniref:hypothetical protein n=1 Tax=Nostoc sp. TaxID=1180 RepID=UPI002FFCA340